MRIIYIESIESEEAGECQGAFTEEGEVLGIWSDNDANWRHEYFNSFMTKLGIEVRSGKYEDRLEEEAIRLWS